jgi:hypothetical protein
MEFVVGPKNPGGTLPVAAPAPLSACPSRRRPTLRVPGQRPGPARMPPPPFSPPPPEAVGEAYGVKRQARAALLERLRGDLEQYP